jgi:hypothetical protein
MPFTPTDQLLEGLLKQALDIPEIREKLETSECNEAEVKEFIRQRAADIWSSAGPQIAAFNDAEKAATTADAESKKVNEHKPWVVSLFDDVLPTTMGFFLLSLFLLFSSTVRHLIASAYQWVGNP